MADCTLIISPRLPHISETQNVANIAELARDFSRGIHNPMRSEPARDVASTFPVMLPHGSVSSNFIRISIDIKNPTPNLYVSREPHHHLPSEKHALELVTPLCGFASLFTRKRVHNFVFSLFSSEYSVFAPPPHRHAAPNCSRIMVPCLRLVNESYRSVQRLPKGRGRGNPHMEIFYARFLIFSSTLTPGEDCSIKTKKRRYAKRTHAS